VARWGWRDEGEGARPPADTEVGTDGEEERSSVGERNREWHGGRENEAAVIFPTAPSLLLLGSRVIGVVKRITGKKPGMKHGVWGLKAAFSFTRIWLESCSKQALCIMWVHVGDVSFFFFLSLD
jgi:hypothetical protein